MKLRHGPAMLLLCFCTSAASADDFYYMLVFGSQRNRPNPNYSHTFATFVHATGDGPCPESMTVEDVCTISWLPVRGKVHVHALFPEPGRNYELHETICWAYASHQRVSAWGPYQIEKCLYDRALDHCNLLNCGQVRYKAADMWRRTSRVSNCLHAVSSSVEGYRIRVATPSWGQTASYVVTRRFEKWIINPDVRHEWVSTVLDLDQYPLIYRDLQNPRTNSLWYMLRLFVGGG